MNLKKFKHNQFKSEEYPINKNNRINNKKQKYLYDQYIDEGYSYPLHKEGEYFITKKGIFDISNSHIGYDSEKQSFYYIRADKIPKLGRYFDNREFLFERIEWLGWDIRILRKNEPYVDYYYQTSLEKPKSKYELYKDLENLVFMKLDQMYSYGAHEYEICLNYGGRENLEESYKNILLLRNNRRCIYVEIDVKKHNTVKKVIDYLLSRGYGVLLPSLVPKDYDCYYYWTEQFLKDGTFVNHHNNLPKKRFLKESEQYFLDVIKLLIQNHRFEVKFINEYKFDELYILMNQLIVYYNLRCNKNDRKHLSF